MAIAAEHDSPRTPNTYLAVTAAVFAAYFIAGKLGQATTEIRSSNLGPVWPAYGVALAAVLLCGRRAWFGIFTAAFAVAFYSPVSHIAAAGQAAGATLAALAGGLVLRDVSHFDPSLSRLRDALALIVVGALGSAMLSATLGMTALYATDVQPYSGIGSAWLIYWLGDSTGVLLITPLVLTAALSWTVRGARLVELSALLALLALACFLIFGDLPLIPVTLHVLAFAVLPFVIWAAIRFGIGGVAVSTLLVATIATIETALGSGPFAQNTTLINATLLDVFFGVLSVSGLTLAAVIAEREQAVLERERLITRQAAVEARLESEDQLRLILDSTAEAIFGVDLEGRCTFCNPACLRALGYKNDADLLGRRMHDVMHHTRADGTPYPIEECTMAQAIGYGRGAHFDDELLWRADGTSFPAECWSHPQLKGSQVVGAVAAFIDITQRKQAEMETAALRDELVHLGRVTMLEALSGSLAHEINQPLTAVMANSEAALRLMTMQPPPLSELREVLHDIRSDNRRAGDVVQRMRTLLKKSATRYEAVEINSTAIEVVKLINNRARARGITIDVELASDIEAVFGDRVQLQQVILNLLMNACDAVHEQDNALRRVHLRTIRRDQQAVVEVRDQGPGLSDADLEIVFEPFYTTKHDGMGLGLSICRAIVSDHGGRLDATRNTEGGMTFTATFPYRQSLASGHRKGTGATSHAIR